MPINCMMAGAQDRDLRRWAAAAHIGLRQWLCIDDFVFQATPDAAPRVLAKYENTYAAAGIEFVRRKCSASWPLCAAAAHAEEHGGNGLLAQYGRAVSAIMQAAERAASLRWTRVWMTWVCLHQCQCIVATCTALAQGGEAGSWAYCKGSLVQLGCGRCRASLGRGVKQGCP